MGVPYLPSPFAVFSISLPLPLSFPQVYLENLWSTAIAYCSRPTAATARKKWGYGTHHSKKWGYACPRTALKWRLWSGWGLTTSRHDWPPLKTNKISWGSHVNPLKDTTANYGQNSVSQISKCFSFWGTSSSNPLPWAFVLDFQVLSPDPAFDTLSNNFSNPALDKMFHNLSAAVKCIKLQQYNKLSELPQNWKLLDIYCLAASKPDNSSFLCVPCPVAPCNCNKWWLSGTELRPRGESQIMSGVLWF